MSLTAAATPSSAFSTIRQALSLAATRAPSRVGWTIGGGVEYAITNNITIKGEYLYADLGSSKFTTTPNGFAAANFPGVVASGKIDWNASIFRAGVNYKF